MGLAIGSIFLLARIHTDNLDLHIDLNKTFAERVDLDETRIDCAIESAKLGDQANVTLRDRLVRVRTDDTARNGTHSSDAGTQSIDHAIPSQ